MTTTQETPSVDWASLAAQAQPRRKTVALCLRGDLAAELEAAEDTGDGARVEELTAAVHAATVTFTVQGLTRDKYRALEAQHPDPDGGSGWNVDTFPEALVRACLVTPEVQASDPLFAVLTPAQVERLFEAAFLACNEVDDLPLRKRG